MRGFALSLVGVSLMAACGGRAAAPRSPAPPEPADGQIQTEALGFVLPAGVRAYRLTESYAVEGHPRDRGFRYADGSPTRVSVFLRPADSTSAIAEPRQVVATEGPLFTETLPIGVQRGWYDAYTVAFAHVDSLDVDGRMLFSHVTAAPTRRGNQISVEFQYLYLVGTRFLKVRATVPAAGWENTDVPLFAKELATVLARQLPPSP